MTPPIRGSIDPLALIAEKLAEDLVEVYTTRTVDEAAHRIYQAFVAVRAGEIKDAAMLILESGDLPRVMIAQDQTITELPTPPAPRLVDAAVEDSGDLPSESTEYTLLPGPALPPEAA